MIVYSVKTTMLAAAKLRYIVMYVEAKHFALW